MTAEHPPSESALSSLLTAVTRRIAAFLLVACLVMLPLLSGTAGASVRLLVILLAIAAAFFHALGMLFDERFTLPRGWLPAAGALVLLAAILSAIRSDCPQASLTTVVIWLGYAAGFLLAWWIGSRSPMRGRIIRALCAVALPVAVYAILQYVVLLDQNHATLEHNKASIMRDQGWSEQDYAAALQRTVAKRVFGPFALPNTLAGFLLLLIPPTIALAAFARAAWPRLILAAAAAVLLLALFLTFSKGGWLAGGAVLLLFLILQGGHWLARRWPICLAALATIAVILAASVALSPVLAQRLRDMAREFAGSQRVRTEYWQAGLSMWHSNPILGVGPGNFQNHYMKHKSVAAEETKSAHNDYVQILAECGPLALLGYAVLWALSVAGAFWKRNVPAAHAPPPPSSTILPSGWFVIAAAVAIAASFLLATSLTVSDTSPLLNTGFLILCMALWYLVYSASEQANRDADIPPSSTSSTPSIASMPSIPSVSPASRGITTALGLGLVGFVLHSFVDFDLYVEGVGYIAFVAAGLAAAVWLPARTFWTSGRRQVIAVLVSGTLVLAFLYCISRASEADSYRSYGSRLARQSIDTSSAPSPEALDALREACRLNPLDDQSFAALGGFSHSRFLQTRSHADADAALTAWERAVALNPTFPEYHAHLGRLLILIAQARPEFLLDRVKDYAARPMPPGTDNLAALPGRAYLPGLLELQLAVHTGPTKPQYRILLADALDAARLPALARAQYRKALDLNAEMIRGQAPARQLLTGDEVQFLRHKLGLTPSPGDAIITPR